MIWFLLQKVGFYIFLFLTIYFVANKKFFNLLVLYFWGMAFATCYQFVYTIWFPTKVVALGMVASMIFLADKKRKSIVTGIIKPFVIIFLLTLTVGDILGFLSTPEYAHHINRISRIINTNYTYLTTLAVLFYGTMLPKGFVKQLYPQYCLAVEVAIVFGIIHFLCMKAGIEFMPILRQDGSFNEEAAFASATGERILRIYGVSGEPKSLAFLVLPYLIASLIMFSQGIYRRNSQKYHLVMLFAGIMVLIYTFSSAALITFAVGVPVIMWFLPLKHLVSKLIPAGVIAILAFGLWSAWDDIDTDPTFQTEKQGFIGLLYDRSFGRAQEEMEGDRQERVILDHFIGDPNPLSRVIGYGTAQYTFHIPGQTIGNALIPVQSGFVLSLCDFGLLGIALYIILTSIVVKTVIRSYHTRRSYGMAFGGAALASLIGSFMFGSVVTCLIYLLPALYGLYDFLDKKQLARLA